jgi:hypothetical protein
MAPLNSSFTKSGFLILLKPAVPLLLCVSVAVATGIRLHSNATHLKASLRELLVAVVFRDGSPLKRIWENLYVHQHTYQPPTVVYIYVCVLAVSKSLLKESSSLLL